MYPFHLPSHVFDHCLLTFFVSNIWNMSLDLYPTSWILSSDLCSRHLLGLLHWLPSHKVISFCDSWREILSGRAISVFPARWGGIFWSSGGGGSYIIIIIIIGWREEGCESTSDEVKKAAFRARYLFGGRSFLLFLLEQQMNHLTLPLSSQLFVLFDCSLLLWLFACKKSWSGFGCKVFTFNQFLDNL